MVVLVEQPTILSCRSAGCIYKACSCLIGFLCYCLSPSKLSSGKPQEAKDIVQKWQDTLKDYKKFE